MPDSRVTIHARIPKDLILPFLQHMRDFDIAHDPLHQDKVVLLYFVESTMSDEEFHAMIHDVNPPIGGPVAYFPLNRYNPEPTGSDQERQQAIQDSIDAEQAQLDP